MGRIKTVKMHSVTCPCGAVFRTVSAITFHCPSCRKVCETIYNRWTYRVRHGKATKREMKEELELEYNEYLEKCIAGEAMRCLYCGKQHFRTGKKFCAACEREGFATVCELTGKSNGWDVVKKEAPAVAGGWRGRRVAGGHKDNLFKVAVRMAAEYERQRMK